MRSDGGRRTLHLAGNVSICQQIETATGYTQLYNFIFYITVTYGQMMTALCGRNMQLFRFSSVVGIATGYGLDGPGIESRPGRDIPQFSRVAMGPTHLAMQ